MEVLFGPLLPAIWSMGMQPLRHIRKLCTTAPALSLAEHSVQGAWSPVSHAGRAGSPSIEEESYSPPTDIADRNSFRQIAYPTARPQSVYSDCRGRRATGGSGAIGPARQSQAKQGQHFLVADRGECSEGDWQGFIVDGFRRRSSSFFSFGTIDLLGHSGRTSDRDRRVRGRSHQPWHPQDLVRYRHRLGYRSPRLPRIFDLDVQGWR